MKYTPPSSFPIYSHYLGLPTGMTITFAGAIDKKTHKKIQKAHLKIWDDSEIAKPKTRIKITIL